MKESLLTDVFLHSGLFLALAALIIPLLRYLKIPAVLGYLFAGIILGPYALGAVTDVTGLKDAAYIKILAELGIVLLLFVIGLEITPRRLWQMRGFVFGLGGLQVGVTALCIGAVAFLWGNNVQVSVLLGLGLALSSTAIVIQWLHEKKLFVSHVGRASFSILLLQDLAVIPILLLLTILSAKTGGHIVEFVSISLLKMVVTVVAIYIVGKIILKPIFLFANKHGGAEVFMALSLLIIVTCASVAAAAGLSMALGAFIAGLLLADTEYRHEIAALVTPFKSMLIGIFFLSFGMGINLSFIAEKPFWLFASVFGLMALKGIIIFVLCKLWKQSNAVSVEAAILLSQAGEFGLLVVGTALTAGLMEEGVAQFMLIVVGMTMIIAPAAAPVARKIGQIIEDRSAFKMPYTTPQPDDITGEHIVIFGFGRVGQAVGNILSKEGYKILGFDKSISRVNEARSMSSPVYLGDALRRTVLMAANIERAKCVVVTVDDVDTTRRIVRMLRAISHTIPIVIRAQNADIVQYYAQYEHIDAIGEDVLVGTEMSQRVLTVCGSAGHYATAA